ncbi:HlyD family efflux transporter periplasmic adaptor subunit [Chryseobacterium sp. SSA4.19]|uniref:HlyD family efflux transporter periplasmic adaptor subunit n=1 Tax=Chryseobacterium sp. SSA4.19 TaxID=2919915 RepID=UPI001F4E747E|nr:HlyD family efflux transporter periplasmic adaptor subunit [Chryseobacterium sp. SSA4.19]MCJ8153283.1 HlyD family efflux transporter periplasmic adaptor subunit [Chryseobacterium sp. SSA4.19]
MSKKPVYSEEFDDAISKFPKFNSLLFYSLVGIIVVAVTLLQVIKSPEIVIGEARVTAEKPPIEILSQNYGKIIFKKFVPHKFLKRGEYLAIMENPSDEDDILALKILLLNYSKNLYALKSSHLAFAYNADLGELEEPFFNLLNTLYGIEKEKGYNENDAKKQVLNQQNKKYFEMISKRNEIKNVKRNEIKLLKNRYKEDSLLMSKGLITKIEYENSQRNYLRESENLKNYEAKDVENNFNISDNKANIHVINTEKNLNLSDLEFKLISTYNQMLQDINFWESKYVIKMPIDGTVDMMQFISSNQFIKQGESIFSVLPNNNMYIAQLLVPPAGAGKIKVGQNVSVKLASFPFQEYGKLEGKIQSISLIPAQNYYLILVKLPAGLRSDTGNVLAFSKNMVGQAEIITNKRSLLSKLFSKITNIFEKEDNSYQEKMDDKKEEKNSKPL